MSSKQIKINYLIGNRSHAFTATKFSTVSIDLSKTCDKVYNNEKYFIGTELFDV